MNNTMFTNANRRGTNNKEENKMTNIFDEKLANLVNEVINHEEESKMNIEYGNDDVQFENNKEEMTMENVFTKELDELENLKTSLLSALNKKAAAYEEYSSLEKGSAERLTKLKEYSYFQELEADIEQRIALRLIRISDAEIEAHEQMKEENEEKEEEKEMDLVKIKEVMERRMDKRVSNYLGEGHTVKETILMVHDTIEIAEKNAMSSNEKKAKGAMFAGAYLMETILPQLEDTMVKEAKDKPDMDKETQERFDKMSEQLDDIKETMREYSEEVKEEKNMKEKVKEKVKETTAGRSVASETDKVLEKAEEVFTQSSKVVKSATKKTVSVAKKAEHKFGRFMGEFLAKSAMKEASKNRQ